MGLTWDFFLGLSGLDKLLNASNLLGIVGTVISFYVMFLLFFSLYGLFIPACVIEGRSGLGSLKRSQTLTKNNQLAIIGLFILLGIGGLILMFLASVFAVMVAMVAGFQEKEAATVASAITGFILVCPLSAFYSVALTVAFLGLRDFHEGPDIAPAKVFSCP
jgi:hypothetical protein